jgi:hypothetical protein
MTRKTLISLIGGTGILLVVVFTIVHAATISSTPVGTVNFCPNICMAQVLNFPGVPSTNIQTSGTGSFTTTSNTSVNKEAGIPASTTLEPGTWKGTGNNDKLGAITWEFDQARNRDEGLVSTVVANQLDDELPATGDLYFHIRGTLGAAPGTTYQSVTPLHLRNTNLKSYDPIVGELFTLVEDIPFEDVNKPGITAFTLSNLTLSVN